MTAGMPKMTISESTSFAQSSIGMRYNVIQGTRYLRMVVAKQTATPKAETSVKVIIWAQKSARLPGEYCGPESGGYANHPTSAPVFRNRPIHNIKPPKR